MTPLVLAVLATANLTPLGFALLAGFVALAFGGVIVWALAR